VIRWTEAGEPIVTRSDHRVGTTIGRLTVSRLAARVPKRN
jgi:hypothetical protein